MPLLSISTIASTSPTVIGRIFTPARNSISIVQVSLPPSLFDQGNHCLRLDLLPRGHIDLFDASWHRGHDRHLHLHRFQDSHLIILFYLIPCFHRNRNNLTHHWHSYGCSHNINLLLSSNLFI